MKRLKSVIATLVVIVYCGVIFHACKPESKERKAEQILKELEKEINTATEEVTKNIIETKKDTLDAEIQIQQDTAR